MSQVSPARYVPYGFARQNQMLVSGVSGDSIEVWVGEATPSHALAELARTLPLRVVAVRKDAPELSAAIARAYSQQEGSAASVVDEVESDLDLSRLLQDIPKIEDLLETEDDAPIIRMINALLTQAARDGASDIHIEPFESYSMVRFRVDGALRDVVRPKRELHAALVSRIKIMASLDIAEKRLPQDGRITLRIGGRAVDVRVSTLPTGHGERAVLRLLEKEAGRLGKNHHALFGAQSDRCKHGQCHDGRGSDRVRPGRHRSDPGQCPDRHDLCQGPALDPASGPGRRAAR
jgi:general secretion pathway protein E